MSNGILYSADYNWMSHEVRLLDKSGNTILRFSPDVVTDDITKPLTFISKQDNSHITLRANGTITNRYEYMLSASSGVWASYTLGTSLTLMRGDAVSFRISARNMSQDSSNYVSFTANDGVIEAWNNVQSMVDVSDYTLTMPDYGLYRLFYGCSSLIRAPKLPATTLSQSCYYGMFAFSGLSAPPELPATTLAPYCYGFMFSSCSRLTQAPALPATTLAEKCYEYMFSSCGNLVQAPELPATTLARHCYDSMFSGCSSLTQTPVLPASFVPLYGYQSMFERCSSLSQVTIAATSLGGYAIADWLANVSATGDFYCNPNTNFPTDSTSGIPTGWTRHDIALIKALTLTATADNSSVKLQKVGTLSNTFEVDTGNGWEDYAFDTVIPLNTGESCKWRCKSHPTTQTASNYAQFVMTGTIEASGNCNSMLSSNFESITSLSGYNDAFRALFQGCTSLTKSPDLPATTLAGYCYSFMFYGCTSLTQAPELPATALVSHCCYYYMFKDCTSLIQAPQLPATTLSRSCYSYMFNGCTALTQAPNLPVTTLASECYYAMFQGCTALARAPELPATTLATYCYQSMFQGCTSLTQAPELPATTIARWCYQSMFNGCTSLTQAPELPATTLDTYCYYSMFNGCTALTEVCIAATDISAQNCLTNWLYGVSATGDFYCDPNTTFQTDSASGIPTVWTRHNIADYPN